MDRSLWESSSNIMYGYCWLLWLLTCKACCSRLGGTSRTGYLLLPLAATTGSNNLPTRYMPQCDRCCCDFLAARDWPVVHIRLQSQSLRLRSGRTEGLTRQPLYNISSSSDAHWPRGSHAWSRGCHWLAVAFKCHFICTFPTTSS